MLLCTLVVITIMVYAIFAGAIPAQLLQRLRERQTPLAVFGVLLECADFGLPWSASLPIVVAIAGFGIVVSVSSLIILESMWPPEERLRNPK